MQKKLIKYILSALLVGLITYNSVYFKKLNEVKLASASNGFDAVSYARNLYQNKLLPHLSSSVELSKLISLLNTDPDKTFDDHSRALAIGNLRYFLVQGEGTITSIGDDAAVLVLKTDSIERELRLATEFVYGDAIRDASGLVNLTEFTNTADVNKVSEEINKIVRNDVLPPFRSKAKQGDVVKFWGAIELNRAHVNLDSIEVLPVQLTIQNNEERKLK